MATLPHPLAPGFVEVLHDVQFIATCERVKHFLNLQVRTDVRELHQTYSIDVVWHLRRLQVVELREAQEMLTMPGMDFGAEIEQRLHELGRDRPWLRVTTGLGESVLSRIMTNTTRPTLPQMLVLETALGLRRGHFLRQAGFVEDATDVTLEQMISWDPRLTTAQRSALHRIVEDIKKANFAKEELASVTTLPTAPTRAAARKAPKPKR